MENHKYTCHYCFKEYVPNRRRVQKYCSSTCRVKAHYLRNKTQNKPVKTNTGLAKPGTKTDGPTKIDKLSLSGVGNAAIANVATDLLKKLLTKEDNKPATRGDIKALLGKVKERYIKINNMPRRQDGSQPFFDNVEQKVVYFKMKPLWS